MFFSIYHLNTIKNILIIEWSNALRNACKSALACQKCGVAVAVNFGLT